MRAASPIGSATSIMRPPSWRRRTSWCSRPRGSALLETLGWSRDDALQALLPLMEGTLANVAANGIPDAVSGPLRRGDAEAIRRHVAALGELSEPAVQETYRALGLVALDLARQTGLDPGIADEIRSVPSNAVARD